MSRSHHLDLPFILPSQADKHVTYNEAISDLDAMLHLSVVSRIQLLPPSVPDEGARYIIPSGATGVWAAHFGKLSAFIDGGWRFYQPKEGWHCWVADEAVNVRFRDNVWEKIPLVETLNPASMVGINASADTVNRLAIKTEAVLISHETNGTGGIQVKLNKQQTSANGSLVFQTNWSARAEMGLCGDDALRLKVSSDGVNFKSALIANPSTGGVELPGGLVDSATGLRALALVPAPVKDIWRSDMDSPPTPRTYIVAGVVGSEVTITSNDVEQFFCQFIRGAAKVRIWNVSKSPAQAAWVNWNSAANVFAVHDAANVSSWLAGDMLRVGDPSPTGTNALGMVALDISDYLFNNFGTVFPQRGLKLAMSVVGVGGRASVDCSGNGAIGTAVGAASNSDGSRQGCFIDVFTSILSPISNSNLLFIREGFSAPATALAVARFIRVVGVWV